MQRNHSHIPLVTTRVFSFVIAFLVFLFSTSSFAIHEDFEQGNWGRPALIGTGTVAGFYLLSRVDDSSTIFGSIYALGSLYTFKEWADADADIIGLVLPFSLLTLAMVNFAVFHDEQTFHRDEVFLYNIAAVGALTAYFVWDHALAHGGFAQAPKRNWSISPLFAQNNFGLQTTIYY